MSVQSPVDRYEYRKCLSSGSLFESWVAFDQSTSRSVLLKKPSDKASIPLDECNALLRSSYSALKELRHPNILSPRRLFDEDGKAVVEYPYVPDSSRIPLTQDSFSKDYKSFLLQLFSAVDFVHCMGYVHCDLKRDNIVLIDQSGISKLQLTDFDFVAPSGARPNSRVFGSPLHIAPEILRNEIVLPQSDFYSLGVMLHSLVHRDPASQTGTLPELLASGLMRRCLEAHEVLPGFEPFVPMINELTQVYYHQRPVSLGEMLSRYAAVLQLDTSKFENQLMWSFVRARYRIRSCHKKEQKAPPSQFLTREARIMGIPEEITNDLAASPRYGQREKIRIVRRWLLNSPVSRLGNHWMVTLGDAEIRDFYRRLGLFSWEEYAPSQNENALAENVRRALRFKAGRQNHKSLLLLKDIIEFLDKSAKRDHLALRARLVIKLGEIYRSVGRSSDAREAFQIALNSGQVIDHRRSFLLWMLADMHAVAKDQEVYGRHLEEAYRLAKKLKLREMKAKILSKQLWSIYTQGRPGRALERFLALKRFVAREQMQARLLICLNAVGCIHWTEGRLKKAQMIFLEGISIGKKGEPSDALISLYLNSGLVLIDLGLYRRALHHLQTAQKLSRETGDKTRVPYALLNLAHCHAFLGQCSGAEDTLYQYLWEQIARNDPGGIGRFYLTLGWLNLRSGKYPDCAINLDRARSLFKTLGVNLLLGRAQILMATLFHWQGKLDQAQMLATEAKELLEPGANRVSALDAKLLELDIDCSLSGSLRTGDLEKLLVQYSALPHYHGVAECLFLLLRAGQSELATAITHNNRGLLAALRKSQSPYLHAVQHHLEAYAGRSESPEGVNVKELKEAFVRYSRLGLCFHALSAARQTAEYYEAIRNPKLSARFLKEAFHFAELLGNESAKNGLQTSLQSLKGGVESDLHRLQTFSQISHLLNSISDYRQIVQSLLGFALDLTGAERGALLLSDEHGQHLKVETSIECDQDSVADILKISQGVAENVYRKSELLLIENAQRDSITSSYKSVVLHNILSIACVPLFSQEKLVGVLYLDHHSIPGLFSTEDRELVQAIANFIGIAIAQAKYVRVLKGQNTENYSKLRYHGLEGPFITQNKVALDIIRSIPIIANSEASVLLLGESGTGKEILARMIHEHSGKKDGPFITLNCAALEGTLLESDLFGIERGVATGVSRREGKLQAADGGTLFLDEIGDLPTATQAKLLRVLEARCFEMVGSNKSILVDARLVTATNKDIDQLIKAGAFRADLYHRINTVEIRVPPLRDRLEDVEPLLEHFLSVFARDRKLRFSSHSIQALSNYSWPGNVRELRNLVERLCILVPSGRIDVGALPPEITGRTLFIDQEPLRSVTAASEMQIIVRLLREHSWNQSAVARRLQLPLSTLQRRMRKYGITKDQALGN